MIGTLGYSKMKYSVLNELLPNIDKRYKEIDLIVDLKTIIRKIYNIRDYNEPTDENINLISSEFINIGAYYRNYFVENGFDKVRIIYLYSKNKCKILLDKYKNYKDYYYNKYFDNSNKLYKIVQTSISLLEKLSKYMPNTLFFDTSDLDEFIWTDTIVKNNKNKRITLILSNDEILYQSLNKNTFGLYTSSKYPSIMTRENVIPIISKIPSITLSTNLLPLYLSLIPSHLYSIIKIPRSGTISAARELQRLVDKNLLYDTQYMSIPDDIIKYSNLFKNNIEDITKNYSVIYPITEEVRNRYSIIPKINGIKNTRNYYSEFLELNKQYYLGVPLDIEGLYKGETK